MRLWVIGVGDEEELKETKSFGDFAQFVIESFKRQLSLHCKMGNNISLSSIQIIVVSNNDNYPQTNTDTQTQGK